MATTVTSTKVASVKTETARPVVPGIGGKGPGGNGFRRNGGGGSGRDDGRDTSSERYRIGMWVALAAILMMFTALSSAYFVREGMADDWRPIAMPPVLWASTTLILTSSATFVAAIRALRRDEADRYRRWLLATALLGLCFLAAQFLAWRQLVAQGIYLATNPHSSFFYLLTGLHAIHLIGGICALGALLVHAWTRRDQAPPGERQRAAAGAVGLYWHFMDGLWIYLFVLLFVWR
jgi:cytochrome c oxidase subunit 3